MGILSIGMGNHVTRTFQRKKTNMSKGLLAVLVVLAMVAFGGCGLCTGAISINNTIVTDGIACDRAWGQVEDAQQRRFDLIPQLADVVQGYAKHEERTLTEVQQARSAATAVNVKLSAEDLNDPAKIAELQKAQAQTSGIFGRLMAVAENYPNLKADQSFLKLQDEIAGAENRLSVARRRYNEAVEKYNNVIGIFPNSYIASVKGARQRAMFKADEDAKSAPKMHFDTSGPNTGK